MRAVIVLFILALMALPVAAHSCNASVCQIVYANAMERAFTLAPWIWATASTLLAVVLVWRR